MCIHAPGVNQIKYIFELHRFVQFPKNNYRIRRWDFSPYCKKTEMLLHFCAFPCKVNLALLKNGPLVSNVLHDQATGSAMHNAPVLPEERAGKHERPSKLSATVASCWHVWAPHLRSEGNFTPNRWLRLQ